jgi:hypothetical protein
MECAVCGELMTRLVDPINGQVIWHCSYCGYWEKTNELSPSVYDGDWTNPMTMEKWE